MGHDQSFSFGYSFSTLANKAIFWRSPVARASSSDVSCRYSIVARVYLPISSGARNPLGIMSSLLSMILATNLLLSSLASNLDTV